MLTRRFRRGQEADREKTLAQDGFSATIDGGVPAVSPRPWHDDTTPFTPISEEMLHQMKLYRLQKTVLKAGFSKP